MKVDVVRHTSQLKRAAAAVAIIVAPLSSIAAVHTASAVTAPSAWRIASTSHHDGGWYATTFAAGRFVVVGHGAVSASSSNGATWIEHAAPAGSWQSLAYGDAKFVALSSTASALEEMTSSDGVHWRPRTGPSGEWTGLTYGASRFVAVSALGQLITSLDGVHWTPTWTRSQFLLNSVTYGNGRFVAVDSADGDALISLDGFHWSFYPISTPGSPWFAVTYGNGTFSVHSPSGLAATSMLGYVWVTHDASPPQQMNASTFGCNTFVATGQASGRVNNLISSHLGSSWSSTPVPFDATANWTGVAYGFNQFVAVNTSGDIARRHVGGYCGPTVATPPHDVSGNVANGQVWTYQHPPSSQGGAPMDGYLVTVSHGTRTWTCHAPVYYEPNCIIRGLANGTIYHVTTQVHNRFGYSAPTDPEFVIPVSPWRLRVVSTSPTVILGHPVTMELTGIIANAAGIYPQSVVVVHFGAQALSCVANPFGECLVDVLATHAGRVALWANYVGYGVSYRSPISYVTVATGK